jgi:hypothetical protein
MAMSGWKGTSGSKADASGSSCRIQSSLVVALAAAFVIDIRNIAFDSYDSI